MGIIPHEVNEVAKIPFLPISFFKSQQIKTGRWETECTFLSSATTGQVSSRHEVKDLRFYRRHTRHCFEHFFGPISDYHFFALLPSYLERKDSSLISMMDYFITESKSKYSGFYLSNLDQLLLDIQSVKSDSQKKIIIWGVSFALLELAEQYAPDLSGCLIFETGGMKGRRAEITRSELHTTLIKAFNVPCIYSEYGMAELFSQAYTSGGLAFQNPPWMRIIIREIGDPFMHVPAGITGGINIIDLANYNTMSFIETEDAGLQIDNNSFEVLGRLDNSDMRGCNLLMSN